MLVVAALACGPTVATSGDDTAQDSSGDEVTTAGGGATSVSTSSGTTSSSTTDATDDGPPSTDTGDLDPSGCPWQPCDISAYCNDASGTCLPKPESPPICEAGRIALVEDSVAEALPGIFALGLANVDGVGAREVVAIAPDGLAEIRTAALESVDVVDLGVPLSDAIVAGRAGDGFGRIWGRRVDDGQVVALTGDGAGGFTPFDVGVAGGVMAAADLDGDGDSDLAVAVDDAIRIVVAGEVIELGAEIPVGFAARSLGATLGDDGFDLLVGGETALLRLRNDGAGGFGASETAVLLHPADAVGGSGAGNSAMTHAVQFGADTSLSLSSSDDEAWRWTLPGAAVSHAAAIAEYGDPDGINAVLLLGGDAGVTLVVEPNRELPCRAFFAGPAVRATLAGSASVVLATDGELRRMLLQ